MNCKFSLVFFLIFSIPLLAQDDIRIISSDRNSVLIQYTPSYTDSSTVKIKVYTVAGRLIREIERNGITSKFVKVDWDGRDQNGDLLANGTYLYKVIVHSTDGRYSQSALGKLAKIR